MKYEFVSSKGFPDMAQGAAHPINRICCCNVLSENGDVRGQNCDKIPNVTGKNTNRNTQGDGTSVSLTPAPHMLR